MGSGPSLVEQHEVGPIAFEPIQQCGRESAQSQLSLPRRARVDVVASAPPFDLGELRERNARDARVARVGVARRRERGCVALGAPERVVGCVEGQDLGPVATRGEFAEAPVHEMEPVDGWRCCYDVAHPVPGRIGIGGSATGGGAVVRTMRPSHGSIPAWREKTGSDEACIQRPMRR